LCHSCQQVLS